ALAQRERGAGGIATAFIGDGTLGQGVVYESLNYASLWKLPLLVVLEHNGYAQSTPSTLQIAGDVEARAAAFGIETTRLDSSAATTSTSSARTSSTRTAARSR